MDDFGYFGEGLDGYVHYKQSFDENFKGEDDAENLEYEDCSEDSSDEEE